MCVEYVPLQTNQRLLFADTLRMAVPEVAFKPSAFPLDAAPFIRRNPTSGAVECIAATFGLIPAELMAARAEPRPPRAVKTSKATAATATDEDSTSP
jgi:hypothetical protein